MFLIPEKEKKSNKNMRFLGMFMFEQKAKCLLFVLKASRNTKMFCFSVALGQEVDI